MAGELWYGCGEATGAVVDSHLDLGRHGILGFARGMDRSGWIAMRRTSISVLNRTLQIMKRLAQGQRWCLAS